MIGTYSHGRTVKQGNFGQTSIYLGNGNKALQIVSIDDRDIEAYLGAAEEEDGIDDFTGNCREPEVNIGSRKDCFDVRDLLSDETDGFDGFDGSPDFVLVAGSAVVK